MKRVTAEGAMEPLINLPESAKARIAAREAEAKDYLNRVKRACEQDIANAYRIWGGYFDLHRNSLRHTTEEAGTLVEAAEELSAQLVFTAHATEYRESLRDPQKLKPLLATLREAVIKRYGERVRRAIQCKETQQMEKASEDWNTESEVEVEYAPPILAGDAAFWRARRQGFREYNTQENAPLLADWDSPTGAWSFRGSPESQDVFKSLATIAAKGAPNV